MCCTDGAIGRPPSGTASYPTLDRHPARRGHRRPAIWGMLRSSFALRLICLAITVLLTACSQPVSEPPVQPPAPAPRAAPVKPAPAPQSGEPESALQEIRRRGEVRVGMQEGYVPFQMTGPDGSLLGFDVDTADFAARALKVNVQVVRQSWEELIPSLLAGRVDVIMSGMTVTPERNMEVLFTNPLLETGRMVLVHASNADKFKKSEDLNRPGVFIVSTQEGPGPLKVRKAFPQASYREFRDRSEAIREVLEKRAHALIDEEFSVRAAVAAHPEKLSSSFTTLTYEPVAWAVRPGDTHWLNWLNNLIRIIQHDGTLHELRTKWFHDYFLDQFPRTGVPPSRQ
jgi:polar amino acid transport system substrate-binding protein